MNTYQRIHTVSGQSLVRSLVDDPTPWSTFLDEKRECGLTVRPADCDGSRSSAHYLVNRMYAARGYTTSALPDHSHPNRITLLASDGGDAVGTISINFEGSRGLLVEETFAVEVQQLRNEGFALCEFIKLAVDGVVQSKRVLAYLMDAAFLCAREFQRCDMALIEVNPRHVRFYESLGFEALQRDRVNLRVNAPAVLMSLDLSFADDLPDEAIPGDHAAARVRRSLYSPSFTPEERSGLVNRLRHSYS